MISPEERRLRGRIGGLTVAARGTVNTAPARAAFASKFEREVDPDGQLDPQERAKRAAAAKRAHFTRLALRSSQARRRGRPSTPTTTPAPPRASQEAT